MRRLLVVLLISFIFTDISQAALPRLNTETFVSDDEIESLLSDIVVDLLRAAGVKLEPKIYLIYSSQVNAATAQGGRMLIYTSLIKACGNPEQLISVLAHEVGHVVAGHVSTFEIELERATIPLIAATILGGIATMATGRPDALIAGIMGGSHLATRGLLRFTRTHESSADQAAVKILQKLNWPTSGLAAFLHKLDKMMAGKISDIDPYTLTHPLSKDRIRAIQHHEKTIKHDLENTPKIPEKYREGFYRIKAKIIGFLLSLPEVLQIYPHSDNSFYGMYARAIAYYRAGRKHVGKAIFELEQLIKMQPSNPFLYELKGQILFENGQVKDAFEPLTIAAQLRPRSIQIKTFLAHVMLEMGDAKLLKKASGYLLYATQRESQNIMAWRLLATAYGRDKLLPAAERKAYIAWCLSEVDFLEGKYVAAEKRLSHVNERVKLPYGIAQRIEDLKYQLRQAKRRKNPGQL